MGNCVSNESTNAIVTSIGPTQKRSLGKKGSKPKDLTESTGCEDYELPDGSSSTTGSKQRCRPNDNSKVAVIMEQSPIPQDNTSTTELFSTTTDITTQQVVVPFNLSTGGGSSSSLTKSTRPSYLLQAPMTTELGAIRYTYDTKDELSDAQQEAKNLGGVPILCIEAEVPGDVENGCGLLSHPLIVEAAETLFVSIAWSVEVRPKSQRFRSGADRKPWYTTVRFLNDEGTEITSPLGGDILFTGTLVEHMIEALKKCNKTIPSYLELLREEESGKVRLSRSGLATQCSREATFACHDFADAEVQFAGIDGVLSVSCAKYKCQKVMKVIYDSKRLSLNTVLRFALSHSLVSTIYFQTKDERVAAQMEMGRSSLHNQPMLVELVADKAETKDDDSNTSSNSNNSNNNNNNSSTKITMAPVYDSRSALRKTEMRYIPMTELQATRANRLIQLGSFDSATHLLSPRQGKILMKAYSNVSGRLSTEAVDVPIHQAWKGLN